MGRWARPAAAIAIWVSVVSCGPLDFEPPDTEPGKACYVDSDCAPNGCCGRGTDVVHVSDAPDCSTVSCDGSCPRTGIKCGCGIPVCRNQRCTAAVTVTPDCQ